MTKKKIAKKNAAGGATLASIPGYMALLSARSHGTISKAEYNRKKVLMLAKLKRNGKGSR